MLTVFYSYIDNFLCFFQGLKDIACKIHNATLLLAKESIDDHLTIHLQCHKHIIILLH